MKPGILFTSTRFKSGWKFRKNFNVPEKSIKSFDTKKKNFTYLFIEYFFYESVTKFSALLLYKINSLEIFNTVDCIFGFLYYREVSKILTEFHFCLGMYV